MPAPRPTPAKTSGQEASLHRGLNAYKDIVNIIQAYHRDKPVSDLPLNGYACRSGSLILERDRVYSSKCPIAVLKVHDHPSYPLHGHEFHEISIILRGTGTNIVDDQSFQVNAGDVFVLHGAHEHAIQNPRDLDVLNICYDTALLHIDSGDFPDAPGYRALFEVEPTLRRKGYFRQYLRLSPQELARIESLCASMDAEIKGAKPAYVSVARSQLMEIIALLSRWYESSDTESLTDTRRITKALQCIESHFAEEVDLTEIYRQSGLSRSHFYRIFKACTNQSPGEYLLHLRLRKAEELLRDPTHNVTEVAFACGFSDSSHFSRAFKTFSGTTPRAYRASHASPPPKT